MNQPIQVDHRCYSRKAKELFFVSVFGFSMRMDVEIPTMRTVVTHNVRDVSTRDSRYNACSLSV